MSTRTSQQHRSSLTQRNSPPLFCHLKLVPRSSIVQFIRFDHQRERGNTFLKLVKPAVQPTFFVGRPYRGDRRASGSGRLEISEWYLGFRPRPDRLSQSSYAPLFSIASFPSPVFFLLCYNQRRVRCSLSFHEDCFHSVRFCNSVFTDCILHENEKIVLFFNFYLALSKF